MRSRFIGLVCLSSGLAITSLPCAAAVKLFENPVLRYSIELPDTCRHEVGPGTLEAVCSPDLNTQKSAEISAAIALLLEIDGEVAPADAKPYIMADFRQELPEAVCGEGDPVKVTITDASEVRDGDRVTFRALVACPAIKFLALPARTAEVRYVIATGFRYRLMARVPSDDSAVIKAAASAFFASFKAN